MKKLLTGFFALAAVGTALEVGKPREPISPELAAGAILVNLLMIALVRRM